MKGDNISHNCSICNSNFSYEIKISNYKNCYLNSSYYHYFNKNNYFYSKEILQDTTEYTDTIIEEFKASETIVNVDIENLIQDILKYEKNGTRKKEREEEIEYYDKIIENIESIFTSPTFETHNIDKGEDQVIETEKMTITLSTIKNQKNNLNSNVTMIDLGDCEDLIRKFYNISNNDTLYIKKTDVKQEGMKITKIEYEVYYKFSGIKLDKLNLSICENIKISLSIPIELSESLDQLNSSSDYFNDICCIFRKWN